MRPRLKRALRRIDRDARTIQFGVHPAQAVVLGDVEPAVRRLIDSLDGTRTLEQAIAESELTERSAREVIGMLTRHGVLEDASASPEPLARLTVAERDRLRPDLDRLSLTCDDGGMGALRARRAAHVRVHGAGRVGAQVAVLLAAAGVGNLCALGTPGQKRIHVELCIQAERTCYFFRSAQSAEKVAHRLEQRRLVPPSPSP